MIGHAIDLGLGGRKVLVTGACRGIGRAVAGAFARAGADLAILSDDAAIHEAARALAAETGRPVRSHVCDIADRAQVDQVVGALGSLDVLVNNAGLERITPIDDPADAVDETYARLLAINVLGSFYVTRAAVRTMKPGARIIFTASDWGRQGIARFTGYVSSKHAVIGQVRALARELGPRGIAVNGVCPGWVRTVASLRSLGELAKRLDRSEDDLIGEVMAAQAMPGFLEPDDVTGLYLFLASDLAASITGQNISIDRGEVMS